MVDAGDHEVGLEVLDQAERGEPHAVDRRAVARVAVRAVVERHLGHPQRPPRGDRARRGGHVRVGRDHGQPTSSSAASARRSACSPSAWMPSSFVSSTRSIGSVEDRDPNLWPGAHRRGAHSLGRMGQRRGIAAILAAAAACLVISTLGAYGTYAILDEDAFADRAVSTLRLGRGPAGGRRASPPGSSQSGPSSRAGSPRSKKPNHDRGHDEPGVRDRFPRCHGAPAPRALHRRERRRVAARSPDPAPRCANGSSTMPGLRRTCRRITDPSLLAVEASGREGALRTLGPPARDARTAGDDRVRHRRHLSARPRHRARARPAARHLGRRHHGRRGRGTARRRW